MIKTISYLGLGTMGSGMASNLLKAGYDLTVWNRSAEKCEPFARKSARGVPDASSPIFYRGRLFTIKAEGLISAFDGKTGTPIYQNERINTPGSYCASLVAAAGRIYCASEKGVVTIIDATADLLAETESSRIRKCESCVVHFFDISKKGSRRWCSMNICGNKLKVAAYQRRKRTRDTSMN